jgi:hypothetical protein
MSDFGLRIWECGLMKGARHKAKGAGQQKKIFFLAP